MLRLVPALAALAALAVPGMALAAPPVVSVSASPTSGAAPLVVSLTASGDPATYAWNFGGGSTASGPTVRHTFGPGKHTATVTATSATGETAQARVKVTAYTVTLRTPKAAAYGAAVVLTGRVNPAKKGTAVAILSGKRPVIGVKTRSNGTFKAKIRLGDPGPYRARVTKAISAPHFVRVRSTITATITGSGLVGSQLRVQAALVPRAAGKLRVRVWRDGSRRFDRVYATRAGIALGTSATAKYAVRVSLVSARGYIADESRLTTSVYQPSLYMGSRGPSVLALEQQLYALHYALRGVDTYFGDDTRDAVYAFQKVNGMGRTGAVDAAFWRVLQRAHTPTARYSGDHVEVDKGKQVLFVVRGGKVVWVVHVSTGATGNTPLGTWHVYGKTPGTLPTGMFDSSFFLRGFAVHGYPSVPPWPASHGCVRVPMGLAVRLYGLIPWGSEIDIYV